MNILDSHEQRQPPIRRASSHLLPGSSTQGEAAALPASAPPIRRTIPSSPSEYTVPTPAKPRKVPQFLLFLLALALLAMAAFLYVRSYGVPSFMEEYYAPSEPSPPNHAEIREYFSQAVDRSDLAETRLLWLELSKFGMIDDPTRKQLQQLEQGIKAELAQHFCDAAEAEQTEAMVFLHAEYAAFWPQDDILSQWDMQISQKETQTQKLAEIENQWQAYRDQVRTRALAAATASLDDLAKLGVDVRRERSRWSKRIRLSPKVSIRFRWVPPGSFTMGSPENEEGHEIDEIQHRVTLAKGFWMSETEITQAQWRAMMEINPSNFKGDKLPVETITIDQINYFLSKLNSKFKDENFRLPTEAEWEYACRAGTQTAFNTGRILTAAKANFDGTVPFAGKARGRYREKTTPVGSFAPNAWNLYDMHGNVWELCSDRYGPYPEHAVTDPKGPVNFRNNLFILRGGGWGDSAQTCRSASRFHINNRGKTFNVGFRLVMD